MKTHLLLALILPLSLIAADDEKDFKPLFNGKDLAGWHLRNDQANNAWKVVDGVLQNDLKKGDHGVDLITDAKYSNFTVRYEYLVPEGSNSGFYLRGRYEIQILGDYKTGKTSLGGNGAIYQHSLPAKFVSKPGDQWQTAEVTVIGDKVTVILNGEKIHDSVKVERPTGGELDGNLKEPGPFFLQGDHGAVSFRNLRVKELPKE